MGSFEAWKSRGGGGEIMPTPFIQVISDSIQGIPFNIVWYTI